MTESKKEWKKPELIVMVRSKPEEAVLGACKVFPQVGAIASIFAWCAQDLGGCVDCSTVAAS
jgi:hypothetical protein